MTSSILCIEYTTFETFLSRDLIFVIAQASRPERAGSSRRPQRAQRDSSSDPNDSSGSSEASGETIGEQIVKALGRLEQDMRLVLLRLDSIEDRIRTVSDAVSIVVAQGLQGLLSRVST